MDTLNKAVFDAQERQIRHDIMQGIRNMLLTSIDAIDISLDALKTGMTQQPDNPDIAHDYDALRVAQEYAGAALRSL